MHLRKVYNCPLSCQNKRNCLLFHIIHTWYTQRFQTTIRWKHLSRLLLKMLYRPLVWVTKKLRVKIKSKFVALCCCTEQRQVSHVRRQRIPILNSGVEDPDFRVQSGRILRIFRIWIGYRFRFNRIRNRIIQMKKCDHAKKTWYWIIVVSGKFTIFSNHSSNNLLFYFSQ